MRAHLCLSRAGPHACYACARRCLFCKECIYTAFVQQKRDIEAEMAQCGARGFLRATAT